MKLHGPCSHGGAWLGTQILGARALLAHAAHRSCAPPNLAVRKRSFSPTLALQFALSLVFILTGISLSLSGAICSYRGQKQAISSSSSSGLLVLMARICFSAASSRAKLEPQSLPIAPRIL